MGCSYIQYSVINTYIIEWILWDKLFRAWVSEIYTLCKLSINCWDGDREKPWTAQFSRVSTTTAILRCQNHTDVLLDVSKWWHPGQVDQAWAWKAKRILTLDPEPLPSAGMNIFCYQKKDLRKNNFSIEILQFVKSIVLIKGSLGTGGVGWVVVVGSLL